MAEWLNKPLNRTDGERVRDSCSDNWLPTITFNDLVGRFNVST